MNVPYLSLQKGIHIGIEASFKYMSKNSDGGKGGVVVNISSTAGLTCIGDMYATPAYSASKHAVTALTRTFGVSGTQYNTQLLKFSYLKKCFS